MEIRSCLICTVPTSFTQLGIDACRACAAFFKRTVIAGKTFTCRQGERKCVIRKHENYMCRSCRYDQCVKLGMSYVLPPKRRSGKKTKARTREDIIQSTSPSSSVPDVSRDSLIDRMEAEYKASYKRRLALEKEYAISRNLPRYNNPKHPNKELFVANFTAFYEVFRISIMDSMTILPNVFDDFDDMPIDYRVALFKNFVTKLSMIEMMYYSKRTFKDSTNMFMSSLLTCADSKQTDDWMEYDTHIVATGAFRTTVRGFTNEYKDLFSPMAKMDDLTQREFYALAILNYCDVDASLHLPEKIITNAQNIRAKVFEELQDYYRNELKLHDFSKRLGNLMMLAHGAGKTGALMNEEMRMYATMFDVYSDDDLFREFYSQEL